MAKQRGGLGRGLNALFEDAPRPAAVPVKEEKKSEPPVQAANNVKPANPAPTQQPVKKEQPASQPATQTSGKTAAQQAPAKKPTDIYISEDAIEHAKVVSREARKPVQRSVSSSRPSNTSSFATVSSVLPPKKTVPSKPATVRQPVSQAMSSAVSAAKPANKVTATVKNSPSMKTTPPAKATTAAKPTPKKPAKGDVGLVAIDKIQPNPDQPRTNFKQEEIEELAASIKKEGLLQPILVRKEGDHYQIIAGERRWQACKSLDMKEIPVRFWSADKDKALELALIENIQRTDLNPIEEAYGYKRLMERKGMTQSEIAQTVSKGRSTIANALRLLDLPEDAQQLLFEEKITAGHARAILSIPDAEGRKTLTKKLVEQKLSVRETESLARLLSGRAKAAEMGANKRVPAPASFKKAAKGLTRYLSVPVRVKTVQGKNKIEIQFKDEEELQRIVKLISDVQNAAEKVSAE